MYKVEVELTVQRDEVSYELALVAEVDYMPPSCGGLDDEGDSGYLDVAARDVRVYLDEDFVPWTGALTADELERVSELALDKLEAQRECADEAREDRRGRRW